MQELNPKDRVITYLTAFAIIGRTAYFLAQEAPSITTDTMPEIMGLLGVSLIFGLTAGAVTEFVARTSWGAIRHFTGRLTPDSTIRDFMRLPWEKGK